MESTSFFDEDTTRTFGLYDETLHLFQRIGCGDFFESSWDTFKGPTVEMLSIYKLHTEWLTIPNHITFRAGNTDYSLNMIRINNFLGAPARGIYKNHDNFTAANFWPFLVAPRMPPFHSGNSATSSVRTQFSGSFFATYHTPSLLKAIILMFGRRSCSSCGVCC